MSGQLWAHVERVGFCEESCSGLIRIFEDGQTWGDPYRYAFPFRMVDHHTIELYGIAGRAPTPAESRAMLAECKRRGWSVMRHRRAGARLGIKYIVKCAGDSSIGTHNTNVQ